MRSSKSLQCNMQTLFKVWDLTHHTSNKLNKSVYPAEVEQYI